MYHFDRGLHHVEGDRRSRHCPHAPVGRPLLTDEGTILCNDKRVSNGYERTPPTIVNRENDSNITIWLVIPKGIDFNTAFGTVFCFNVQNDWFARQIRQPKRIRFFAILLDNRRKQSEISFLVQCLGRPTGWHFGRRWWRHGKTIHNQSFYQMSASLNRIKAIAQQLCRRCLVGRRIATASIGPTTSTRKLSIQETPPSKPTPQSWRTLSNV